MLFMHLFTDGTTVYPGKHSFALPSWDWGAGVAVVGLLQGEGSAEGQLTVRRLSKAK